MNKRFAVSITVSLYSMFAHGQDANGPMPNATDLHAAYCIASTQQDIEGLQKFAQDPSTTADLAKAFNEAITTDRERLMHLQRYLLPRLQYLDAQALLAARQQAFSDHQHIQSTQVTQCAEACPVPASGHMEDINACFDRCAPDEFHAINACRDLSWLPF